MEVLLFVAGTFVDPPPLRHLRLSLWPATGIEVHSRLLSYSMWQDCLFVKASGIDLNFNLNSLLLDCSLYKHSNKPLDTTE